MLTEDYPLNIFHFKSEEQSKSPIRLSNLKHPPHDNESKSQSYERLNPLVLFHSFLIY